MSPSPVPRDPIGRHWWHDAVVLQIYVRSFGDADGDGIGDLEGIRTRLDHVAELGVDAIWLNPCYPSPQRDHGYDVADYTDIEPVYGDLATFDRLVADAAARGIRVLMDMVPNHCSSAHPWFQAALAAEPGSPERARFYFRDGRGPDGSEPPNNWHSEFAGSAWTRVPDGQWYLATFTPDQPDFDHTDPEVATLFEEALRFWFDRGVEGFRVDVVTAVGKAPELPDAPPLPEGTPETGRALLNPYTAFRPEGHEVWRRWRTLLDTYSAEHPGRDLMMVAEAYAPRRPDLHLEYVRSDEFHQSFAFDLLLSPWHPSPMRQAIGDQLLLLHEHQVVPTWTLNNHDAQRVVTRLGRADAQDPTLLPVSPLHGSTAPVDVAGGTRRARALIALVLGLPGSAYLYQGEELGLPEVLDLPDAAREDPVFLRSGGSTLGRDGCRVPLPWTADPAGAHGFSAAPDGTEPASPWLPQPAGWGAWAVDVQRSDPASMLATYRRILAARREHAFDQGLRGELVDLHPSLVAVRRGELLLVLNPTAEPIGVDLAVIPSDGPRRATVVLSSATPDTSSVAGTGADGDGTSADGEPIVVPPDTCLWLRLDRSPS